MGKLHGLFLPESTRNSCCGLKATNSWFTQDFHHFSTQSPTAQETTQSWQMVGDPLWCPGSPCSPLARLQRSRFPAQPTFSLLHLLSDDLMHQKLTSHSGLITCLMFPLKRYYLSLSGLNFPSYPSLQQCSLALSEVLISLNHMGFEQKFSPCSFSNCVFRIDLSSWGLSLLAETVIMKIMPPCISPVPCSQQSALSLSLSLSHTHTHTHTHTHRLPLLGVTNNPLR